MQRFLKLASPRALRTLALVVTVAACLGLANGCGCSVRIGGRKVKPSFPVEKELSTVPGVSIVCMDRRSGGSTMASSSGQRAEVRCEGHQFLDSLRAIRGDTSSPSAKWGNRPPIICHGAVPQGYFRIHAHTKRGGRDQLIRLVCQAFTQAGDWRVSLRLVEAEVTALTCPDLGALRFALVSDSRGSSGSGSSVVDGMRSTHGTTTVAQFAEMLTDQSREDAVSVGQEAQRSARFVDETGIEGVVEGEIRWEKGDHAGLLAALRQAGLVPVVKRRLIWAIVVEPKASTSVMPSSLFGVSAEDLVDVLGEPTNRGELSPQGEREFFYDQPDKQISFLIVKGTVRAVGIRSGATVALSETIGIGAPMQRVTDLCGGYTSEQDIGEDTPSDDLREGVLYRQTLPGNESRYVLHYPELKLRVTFLPGRTLHTIWIGNPR
ncbi:MAG: hypothetical protein HN380_29165 [Victivallales bacterium]|jgi:hypothetical protein|nr:hypothetical protein [Victivallales bacterium]